MVSFSKFVINYISAHKLNNQKIFSLHVVVQPWILLQVVIYHYQRHCIGVKFRPINQNFFIIFVLKFMVNLLSFKELFSTLIFMGESSHRKFGKVSEELMSKIFTLILNLDLIYKYFQFIVFFCCNSILNRYLLCVIVLYF